jgi:hypothetical protein
MKVPKVKFKGFILPLVETPIPLKMGPGSFPIATAIMYSSI